MTGGGPDGGVATARVEIKSADFAVGGGIGLVSSMVGAGGAFLSVPFMTACNIGIRNCVATSAALGLPNS